MSEPEEEETACELDTDASVYERWAWVQSCLPPIPKERKNTQQNFNYRGIDDVLDKGKKLVGKAGVFIMPARQRAEYGSYTTGRGTMMNTCRITCMWQIWGVKGDHMTAETVGEAADAFDKSTSKAQTAAFKYLLWPSLWIAENLDNDGETPEAAVPSEASVDPAQALRDRVTAMKAPPEPSAADPITQPQINKIRIETNKLGMAEDGTEVKTKVNSYGDPGWPGSLRDLKKWQASRLIDELVGK